MTVGYGRKIQPATASYDHENEEASIFFEGEFDAGDIQGAADTALALFAVAKIRVLTELSIPFVSDESGVVRESERQVGSVVQQFPGTTILQQQQAPPAAPALYQQVPPAPGYPPAPQAPVQYVQQPPMAPPAAPPAAAYPPPPGTAPLAPPAPPAGGGVLPPTKEQLVALYMQDPSQFWDNRDPQKPQYAPDFRHKTILLPPNSKGKQYNAGFNTEDLRALGYQV